MFLKKIDSNKFEQLALKPFQGWAIMKGAFYNDLTSR